MPIWQAQLQSSSLKRRSQATGLRIGRFAGDRGNPVGTFNRGAAENEGIHFRSPTSAVECRPNGEMGQIFGRLLLQRPFGLKTVQRRPRYLVRTGKLLKNNRFRCGGGGGSRTRVRNRSQPRDSMRSLFRNFAPAAQNRQETTKASPMILLFPHGPSGNNQPAVRRPLSAHRQR